MVAIDLEPHGAGSCPGGCQECLRHENTWLGAGALQLPRLSTVRCLWIDATDGSDLEIPRSKTAIALSIPYQVILRVLMRVVHEKRKMKAFSVTA